MFCDVIRVVPLVDHRLWVELKDGRTGIFDVKPYLEFGVFRELKDLGYFRRVGVLYGAITWPHEQDISPENLLSEWIEVDSPPVDALL